MLNCVSLVYYYNMCRTFHNLDLGIFFNMSLNSRRRIFPLGFLGISSTNTTPPRNRLCADTRLATNCWISFSVTLELAWRTTKARGSSPETSSGRPTTPVSLMPGCWSSRASNSAGGTWNFINVSSLQNIISFVSTSVHNENFSKLEPMDVSMKWSN